MYVSYDASYILSVVLWVRMTVFKAFEWFCLNERPNAKIQFGSYLVYFEKVMSSGPVVRDTMQSYSAVQAASTWCAPAGAFRPAGVCCTETETDTRTRPGVKWRALRSSRLHRMLIQVK